MAKEYLVVLFQKNRRVKINGEYNGITNTKLELESGLYEITLGPPANFAPEKKNIDLTNTTSLRPMLIEFSSIK